MNALVDLLGSVAEEIKTEYNTPQRDNNYAEPVDEPQDFETALFEKIRALELENALLEEKLAKAGNVNIAEPGTTVISAPGRQINLRQMIISQEILGKPVALR
jgi:hypothetical protein